MSEDLFRDTPGDLIPAEPDGISDTLPEEEIDQVRLEGLAQELLELKLVFLSNTDNASREVDRLRRLVNLLVAVGLLITTGFGVALTFVSLRLSTAQSELTQQVGSMAAGNIAVDRVTELESKFGQIEQLEKRLDDLSKGQTAQLEDIEEQLSEVTGSVNTRRQTIAILAAALQDLINEEEESSLLDEAELDGSDEDPSADVENTETEAEEAEATE